MPSGGKEGIWRAELTAAQEAYKQIVAKEERDKRRIATRNVAMDAAMRGLQEAKIYILSLPAKEKPKGMMEPQSATVSLINRGMRAITEARDS